jgi:hypothetical protein
MEHVVIILIFSFEQAVDFKIVNLPLSKASAIKLFALWLFSSNKLRNNQTAPIIFAAQSRVKGNP